MKTHFEVKDIVLAIIFAVIGLLVSTKFVTMFTDSLGPVWGMLLTSAIVLGSLLILSYLDLIIFKFNNDGVKKFFGLLFITFAFMIVTSQSSCYQNLVIGKDCDVCSTYFQSPDGAVWHIWSSIIPVSVDALGAIFFVRMLTYVLTPFVLTLIGGLLIKGAPKIQV